MELYDFINTDFRPSLAKDGAVRTVVEKRETQQEKIEAIESGIEELKKERDELLAQLRTAQADKDAAIKEEKDLRENVIRLNEKTDNLSAAKDELLKRLVWYENNVEMIKKDRSDLDAQLQLRLSELDHKTNEIKRLEAELEPLRHELTETLLKMKHAKDEEKIAQNNLFAVKSDLAEYIEKTKKAVIIACAVVLIAIAFFILYNLPDKSIEQRPAGKPVSKADNEAKPDESGRNLLDAPMSKSAQQKSVAGNVSAAWHGTPYALDIEELKIFVVLLKSDELSKLPALAGQGQNDLYHFYRVEISAKKSDVSEEFLKSPSIDFIGENNRRTQQSDSGSVLRILSPSLSEGQNRTVQFQCPVAVRKDFNPAGIIIGPLNKRILKIQIA
ncbi:MAG: hypothetical protein HQL10_05615 [Nitrospirae bacterium]|uniref:Uncharacterized protein n=1 Tax=uncultured Nitrospirota bacterium TaxID=170969 RepID=A0A142BTU3_9BACT|nr:hypothetical protein [uncultured Nitrospirota bacterium]MBF0328614.1 hypothetical protein [Nitrospirota bacterium]